ncbi:MAG: OmpA family protein [Bdellovibrionota bacterium]
MDVVKTIYFGRIVAASLLIASFVGCQSAGKRTGTGAAAGAVVGGLIGAKEGGLRGAAIGAAAGGAVGGGIGYYLDKRAEELSKVVETRKTDDGLMVTLKNDVLFDLGKTDVKQNARDNLAELAEILKKYPGDKLRITGYTDKTGSAEFNMKLSEKRAEAVRTQLTAGGVAPERTRALGKGEAQARGSETVPNAADRKVEIYIDVEPPKNS